MTDSIVMDGINNNINNSTTQQHNNSSVQPTTACNTSHSFKRHKSNDGLTDTNDNNYHNNNTVQQLQPRTTTTQSISITPPDTPPLSTVASFPALTRFNTPLIFPTGVTDDSGICSTSHVAHRRASVDTPVTPSLVGRQYQRYDGKVRLVCGCVPFRLDLINIDEQAQISVIPQPCNVEPPELNESETSDNEQSDPDVQDLLNSNKPIKVIQSQPKILSINDTTLTNCTIINTTKINTTKQQPIHNNNNHSLHNSSITHSNSVINTVPSPNSKSISSDDSSILLNNNKRLQLCVLLIRASHKDQWVFPKGGWESFESSQECAQRECLEEAGVEGIIIAELGTCEFIRKGKRARLLSYLLQVTQQHELYSELHRNRQWVPVEQARELLSRPESIHAFDQAVTVWKQLGLIPQTCYNNLHNNNSVNNNKHKHKTITDTFNESVILHSSSSPAIVNLDKQNNKSNHSTDSNSTINSSTPSRQNSDTIVDNTVDVNR